MIKRIRGAPPVALPADRGGKRSDLDDVQRVLVERWRRASCGDRARTGTRAPQVSRARAPGLAQA